MLITSSIQPWNEPTDWDRKEVSDGKYAASPHSNWSGSVYCVCVCVCIFEGNLHLCVLSSDFTFNLWVTVLFLWCLGGRYPKQWLPQTCVSFWLCCMCSSVCVSGVSPSVSQGLSSGSVCCSSSPWQPWSEGPLGLTLENKLQKKS